MIPRKSGSTPVSLGVVYFSFVIFLNMHTEGFRNQTGLNRAGSMLANSIDRSKVVVAPKYVLGGTALIIS